MDRKIMCIVICVMIGLGAALFIVGQALDVESKKVLDTKAKPEEKERMQAAAKWCVNLSYLMGSVALLLTLCCMCCRDVSFGKGKDDYD